MLNYIWAGLIVLALVFAVAGDARESQADPFRNGQALPVTVVEEAPDGSAVVRIDPAAYAAHFGVAEPLSETYRGRLARVGDRAELRFEPGTKLPSRLEQIRAAGGGEALVGRLSGDGSAMALTFEPVRYRKLKAVGEEAVNRAKVAVLDIAFGLIGVLALWMGLMRIAEASGLVNLLVKVVRPLLGPLFPGVPKDHPAMGLIAMNLSANALGLGNAATPIGLKAMEELQKLNDGDKEEATDAMVMLLAVNTAGVTLVPPVTVVAVMGVGGMELFVPIWIVTAISLVIAIVTAKLLGRLPWYRRAAVPAAAKREGHEGGAA